MASDIQYLMYGVWCLVESVEVSLKLPGSGASPGHQEGDKGSTESVWYLVSGVWYIVYSFWCLVFC